MDKQRTCNEIMQDLMYTSRYDYKKLRKLHKELKAYGIGLPIMARHYNLIFYGSIVIIIAIYCCVEIFLLNWNSLERMGWTWNQL